MLIQDGDLEYDPNDYARMLEPIVSGRADIVYGSRFLGARIVRWRCPNRIANRVLTAAANLLYGARLTRRSHGLQGLSRDGAARASICECRRFEFCPEVTAKTRRLGYRIHEVPVSYNARGHRGRQEDSRPRRLGSPVDAGALSFRAARAVVAFEKVGHSRKAAGPRAGHGPPHIGARLTSGPLIRLL